MVDIRNIARAHMAALVDWFGCYDAVAEQFNARWGGGASKGTVSKKLAGHLDWTIADVIALEDAAGRFPITRLMARRLETRSGIAAGSALTDASSIAKEAGEAIAAILSAEQSSGAHEDAQAVKEIDEAIAALRRARDRKAQASIGGHA